jgi:hypothetical protein
MSDEIESAGQFRLITAVEAGFPLLYRYQPFDVGRLSQIIRDRVLYFSNPKDFNDPWDCRPWFDVDALANPTVLERHVSWYERVTRTHRPDIPVEEMRRTSEIIRSDPTFLRERISEVARAIETAIHDRYRVYCLGSTPTSELMWAHYAAKHTGICLEFQSRNLLFCHTLKIHYQKSYPIFDLTSDTVDDNLATLLIKSAAWQYEGEYRLVAQEESSAIGADTLLTRNHFIDLPENALVAVIIGCLAPGATEQTVKDLVRQSGGQISVKRAIRARDQYRLKLVQV